MKLTKAMRWTLVAALGFAQGCHVVSVRLPEEFKGKKQKEDPPPYSGADPAPYAPPDDAGKPKP